MNALAPVATNRWWTPADGVAAVSKALASEATIRARHRATVHLVHREPWLIGSVDAQQTAVAWARIRHRESVERTRALVADMENF
jgi:hypothetical protein